MRHLLISLAAVFIVGCGSGGGGGADTGSGGGNNPPGVPSNYFEATSACVIMPGTTSYVATNVADPGNVFFYSSLANCNAGPGSQACHYGSGAPSCFGVFPDYGSTYPQTEAGSVWVYL